MFRYIELDSKSFVVSVIETPKELNSENYILSSSGEIGQRYVNGEFIDVPVEPQQPIETMEEKIVRLEQQVMNDNLILMDALAMTYEQVMMMRSEMNGGTS